MKQHQPLLNIKVRGFDPCYMDFFNNNCPLLWTEDLLKSIQDSGLPLVISVYDEVPEGLPELWLDQRRLSLSKHCQNSIDIRGGCKLSPINMRQNSHFKPWL